MLTPPLDLLLRAVGIYMVSKYQQFLKRTTWATHPVFLSCDLSAMHSDEC